MPLPLKTFGARGYVREWVSLCIPKTLWTPHLKNQWRDFHPFLVTDVFGFIDMPIKFWDEKVKGRAGNNPKNQLTTISSLAIRVYFAKIRSHVPGPGDVLIRFFGQKVRVTSGRGITVDSSMLSFHLKNAQSFEHNIVIKDVKTGFLTQPVIDLLKPVIYRLPDYVTSHVAWLIVGCRPNISIWGALHSKTGRVSCICDWLRDATCLLYTSPSPRD